MDRPSPRLVGGRYRLLSPLGVGGMGTVWRARDELLGREVAVKEVTFPHGLSDDDREVLRERTRREGRAAARLDHPSAVSVFDVVEEDGSPCLVMELVEGRTLSEVVRSDGPLTPQRTAEVGLALLGALETAHRQGIVHRDVKPGNVLLGSDEGPSPGRVVLTDFGIASTAGDTSITSTGLLLGSPAYIAPERARGQAPRPASDLWSLGATLFTAVEGRPPYDGGEPLLTVTAVVTGEHEPYVAAGPLEPVLEGLLERDPDRRLTAPQARRELLRVADQASTAALPRPSPEAEERSDETSAMDVQDVRDAAGGDPHPHAARTVSPPRRSSSRAAARRSSGAPGAGPLPERPVPARPVPARPVSPRQGSSRQAPSGSTRRRRGWRAPLVLLAAIAALSAAIVTYVLSERQEAVAPPAASVTAAPSPDPAEDDEVSELPPGWTRYEDPDEGWSVGVPPGYEVTQYGEQVQLRNDEQRRTLRVDAASPRGAPLEVAQALSRSFAEAYRDYQQIRLEEVEYRGLPAADLEFTWFQETDLRVLDRTFVNEAGTQTYALYWQTNASDWDDALPVFRQVLETFEPRG